MQFENTIIFAFFLVVTAICLKSRDSSVELNDYKIGKIKEMHFYNEELFFKSEEGLFGYIDRKTGDIKEVFELEKN
jgi:hypothetical protein